MVSPKVAPILKASNGPCFSPSSQSASDDNEKQNSFSSSYQSTQTSYWKFLAAKLPLNLEVRYDHPESSTACEHSLHAIPESVDGNTAESSRPLSAHKAIPQMNAAMNIVSDNPRSHEPAQSMLRTHSFPSGSGRLVYSVSAPVMKSQSRWSPIPTTAAAAAAAATSTTSRPRTSRASPPSPPDSRNARWAVSNSNSSNKTNINNGNVNSNSSKGSSRSGFSSPRKLRQMGLHDLRKTPPSTSNTMTTRNIDHNIHSQLTSSEHHPHGGDNRWSIPSNHSDSLLIYPKRGGSLRLDD